MRTRKVRLLLAAAFMLCFLAPQLRAQEAPRPRLVRIVYDGDLAALLSHVGEAFSVTIGFEEDSRRPNARVKIDLSEAGLEDVLDAIIKSAPGYQWRGEGGAVDIFPKAAVSPILETVVHHFQCSGDDWRQASYALTDLPEVQNLLAGMSLGRREGAMLPAEKNAKQFSLELDGVTVRRSLHEITRKTGGRFWMFRQWDGRSFTIGNSVQTEVRRSTKSDAGSGSERPHAQ